MSRAKLGLHSLVSQVRPQAEVLWLLARQEQPFSKRVGSDTDRRPCFSLLDKVQNRGSALTLA